MGGPASSHLDEALDATSRQFSQGLGGFEVTTREFGGQASPHLFPIRTGTTPGRTFSSPPSGRPRGRHPRPPGTACPLQFTLTSAPQAFGIVCFLNYKTRPEIGVTEKGQGCRQYSPSAYSR